MQANLSLSLETLGYEFIHILSEVDLNLGLDNQRFGVTGNVGYDTKGSAIRGGVGLRVIF